MPQLWRRVQWEHLAARPHLPLGGPWREGGRCRGTPGLVSSQTQLDEAPNKLSSIWSWPSSDQGQEHWLSVPPCPVPLALLPLGPHRSLGGMVRAAVWQQQWSISCGHAVLQELQGRWMLEPVLFTS